MKKLFNQRKRPYTEEIIRNDWENYYEELEEENGDTEEALEEGEETELVYADAVTDYEEISDLYDDGEEEAEEDETDETGEVEYESVEDENTYGDGDDYDDDDYDDEESGEVDYESVAGKVPAGGADEIYADADDGDAAYADADDGDVAYAEADDGDAAYADADDGEEAYVDADDGDAAYAEADDGEEVHAEADEAGDAYYEADGDAAYADADDGEEAYANADDGNVAYVDADGDDEAYAEADDGEEVHAEADEAGAYYEADGVEEAYVGADADGETYAETAYVEAGDEDAYYEVAGDGEAYDETAYVEAGDEDAYYEAAGDGEAYDETAYVEAGDEDAYYEADGDGEAYDEAAYVEAGDEAAYADASEEDIYYEEDGEEIYAEEDGGADQEDFAFEDDTRFDFDLYEEDAEDLAEIPPQKSFVDRLVAFTGVLVLLVAVVTGAFYLRVRAEESQLAGLSMVGASLENIELPGQMGLLAVAQAEATKKAEAEFLLAQQQQEQPEVNVLTKPAVEYEEEEYTNKTTVALNLSSIEKDLKIKFINKESGKLISNVPFSVSIAGAGGNLNLTDDDMDGVIYKSGITPGAYTVVASALSDDKYKDFDLPGSGQTVEVKAEIVYEKVDVSDEVKTEEEVDVAKEDTAVHEVVVEEQLPDTVVWVDSTITASGFKEVEKQAVVDPAGTAIAAALAAADPAQAPGVKSVAVPSEAGMINIDVCQMTMTVGASYTLTVSGNEQISLTEVLWSSNEPAVASVDANGVVTGLSEGTAVISCQAKGQQVSGGDELTDLGTECVVAVEALPATGYYPRNDTENLLLDFAGNQVYVQENGGYREAVFADYYTAGTFYVKEDVKYTGWQTINGSVYYFDANGEKVTGEQVIEGARYTFSAEGVLVTGTSTRGIDVSKYNGDIDWQAVKNSGMEYVIIRCGFRGYSTGKMVEDSKFKENIQGAVNAGLKVGVYFVTQAVSAAEAVEEASMVLDQISGYQLSYPVFLDVEPSGGNGRADKISKETRTAVCTAFCETIQASGYTAGIYASKNWLEEKMDGAGLAIYKIWLAQYAAAPTYTGKYDLWQYQQKGRVSGIEGDVDMNWSFLGY